MDDRKRSKSTTFASSAAASDQQLIMEDYETDYGEGAYPSVKRTFNPPAGRVPIGVEFNRLLNSFGLGQKPSKRPVGHIVSEFGLTTSCHGVPHIERASTNNKWRYMFWWIVLILCTIAFIIQFVVLLQKFFRYDTNVQVKIRFEKIAFPAVTICNLNPFKSSFIRNIPSINKSLEVYEAAIGTTEDRVRNRRDLSMYEDEFLLSNQTPGKDLPRYNIRETECNCEQDMFCEPSNRSVATGRGDRHSKTFVKNPVLISEKCLCFYDSKDRTIWPCYLKNQWKLTSCSDCNDNTGVCEYISPLAEDITGRQCICRRASRFCLLKPPNISRSLFEKQESAPVTVFKKYGFEGIVDKSAIQSVAQENLIFAMQGIDEKDRAAMSYSKEEQILQCSFSGKDCDLDRDFKLHSDPSFGNCYVFNHDAVNPLAASRPGALYGLRLLFFVNRTDYLPTTQAAGVKISVHHQEDYPFPDTFGHSAPTGFLTSFGVRKQLIERLPTPYGDCLQQYDYDQEESAKDYPYGPLYAMEGCHRVCLQNVLIKECGCADARFLRPKGSQYCQADDHVARSCLRNVTEELGDARTTLCECRQPCRKSLFSVTFSTAIWPVETSKVNVCPPGQDCITEYSREAAFIEVFFEQVNYQHLIEHEAYGWVNLLADFGGNISLWLGISVITVVEFFVLIYDLIRNGIWRQDANNPVYFVKLNQTPKAKDSTPNYPFLTDHVDMNVTLALDDM